jgi:hypothetical protein
MKRFLKKIAVLLILSIGIHIIVLGLLFFTKSIKVDLFYDNFTSIHTGSIITGTSRARYAVSPKYLKDSLNFKNFSFTRSKSPYNDSYTDFLIDFTSQKKGMVSIFCVSPIAFEKVFEKNEEYFQKFDFNLKDFKNLNLEYLLEEKITLLNIVSENIKFLFRKNYFGENHEFDNRNISDVNSIKKNVDVYPIPNFLDDKYVQNLERLVHHFKKTSRVFLIRTPVRKELYVKENKLIPRFNDLMDSIARRNSIKYTDLNINEFNPSIRFYDISHVNKNESIRISKIVDSLIQIN